MSVAQPALAGTSVPSGRQFMGHPLGLFVLFFAEMWERFSYYGMRGLLKLYMVNYLFTTSRQRLQGNTTDLLTGDPTQVWFWDKMSQLLPGNIGAQASLLYGLYTGLVYLTPVFGGMLADKVLGQRKTVVVGGLLMAVGHFVMAFENLFFVALALLIVGNGAFKPNISTQVGNLYAPGDSRRDGAFTIFYMGINIGAFICNFICGTLAAVYGWHYGFAAAGVGMLLGLIVYLAGQKFLAPDNMMKTHSSATVQQASVSAAGEPRAWGAFGGTAAAVAALVGYFVYSGQSSGWSLNLIIGLLFCFTALFFVYQLVRTTPVLKKDEWSGVLALVALCVLNVVFWAVYEQQGNTMQTWADEKTVWPVVFGFQIPSTWYQSFNPLFIIVFAPLLDMFWLRQDKQGKQPGSVAKMAIGSLILGVSFLVMVLGARLIGDGKGSMFWPVFCTLIVTFGELYLSPIGLSLVTKVAPARIVSVMMGMWFLSSFLGNYLSGFIGTFYEDKTLSPEQFFWLLTGMGVATAVLMWAASPLVKRAMGANSEA